MMKNKGMTLFIAIVVMSILLFISFAVVNIAVKSSLFAGAGRDSQNAYYAAEAGLECALFWDSKYPIPLTSPVQYMEAFSTTTDYTPRTIKCGPFAASAITTGDAIVGTTSPVTALIGGGDDTKPTSIFSVNMNGGVTVTTNCFIVTVTKYYIGARYWTKIESRGYNTCDTSNSRRVERGIDVTY